MKDCKKIHLLLPLHRDNQLSAREKTAVEKHLRACPKAREDLKQWERLGKALKGLPDPKIPRDLHEKIMARLHGKPAPRTAANLLWVRASWGLAAAAGLAFMFFVQNFGWLGHKNTPVALNPPGPPTVAEPALSASVPLKRVMAMKYQTHRPVNRQVASNTAKKEVAPSAMPAEASQPMAMAAVQPPSPTAAPEMVLALGPTQRSKKKAFTSNENSVPDAMASTSAPAVAAAPSAAVPMMALGNTSLGNSTNTSDLSLNSEKLNSTASPEMSLGNQPTLSSADSSNDISPQTWSGANAPTTVQSHQLLTDSDSFAALWNAVRPGTPVPAIDFTTHAVVFIVATENGNAEYSIHITRLEDQSYQLVVHYQVEATPGEGVRTLSYPWFMQVISKPNKPAVFTDE
jgi:hypothetical protein